RARLSSSSCRTGGPASSDLPRRSRTIFASSWTSSGRPSDLVARACSRSRDLVGFLGVADAGAGRFIGWKFDLANAAGSRQFRSRQAGHPVDIGGNELTSEERAAFEDGRPDIYFGGIRRIPAAWRQDR